MSLSVADWGSCHMDGWMDGWKEASDGWMEGGIRLLAGQAQSDVLDVSQ